jgi:hypothetical protein
MLNFEDVEDRDGELSIQEISIIPVRPRTSLGRIASVLECMAVITYRGYSDSGSHIGPLYTSQAKRRSTTSSLRARDLQTTVPRYSQSLLVCPELTI